MAAQEKPAIGFIGTGHMGTRMAGRLLDAGYRLGVYDIVPEKTTCLLEEGAVSAASPHELAEQSDLILSSLPDDAAVEHVYLGPGGVLEAMRPGAAVIELSTVYPGTSRRLAAAAAARYIKVLDAPVSGSTPQAEAGTLVIMVGGDREMFDSSLPILEVLGDEIFHMGASGAGAAMKLSVNAMLGVGMQALAEAIALGEKSGLERKQVLDVLGHTGVIAPGHKAKLCNAQSGKYPVQFALRLMDKDFRLILRQAGVRNVPMPATEASQRICSAGQERCVAEDFSAIVRINQELTAEAATDDPEDENAA